MHPALEHDGTRSAARDARRRRRLVLVVWIAGGMLAIVAGLFLVSPYELYETVVGRLVETGFIDPGLAHFLAPLPAIAFIYAAADLLRALAFGKRSRAFAAAAALALLGLADAALLGHHPEDLINPVTTRGNYRWYRAKPTPDEPEGPIVLVAPWWKMDGLGHPVYDLSPAVADEYAMQQDRARQRQASLSEQRKALDTEATRLVERTKELDAQAAKLAKQGQDLDSLAKRTKAAEEAQVGPASGPAAAVKVPAPISTETGAAARAPAPSDPEEIPVAQTQSVPIGDGEYALTLRSCRKSGTSVYLYVQYLNRTTEDLDLILDRRESALFDDLGNEYVPTSARFSGDRQEADVPAGLTANAVLRFDDLVTEARIAQVLRIGARWSSNTHRRSAISMGQRSLGEFHGVPISPNAPRVRP